MKEVTILSKDGVSTGHPTLKITKEDGTVIYITWVALMANHYFVDCVNVHPVDKIETMVNSLKPELTDLDDDGRYSTINRKINNVVFLLTYDKTKNIYQLSAQTTCIGIKTISPKEVEIYSTDFTFQNELLPTDNEDGIFIPQMMEVAPLMFSPGEIFKLSNDDSEVTDLDFVAIKEFYVRSAFRTFMKTNQEEGVSLRMTSDSVIMNERATELFREYLVDLGYIVNISIKSIFPENVFEIPLD